MDKPKTWEQLRTEAGLAADHPPHLAGPPRAAPPPAWTPDTTPAEAEQLDEARAMQAEVIAALGEGEPMVALARALDYLLGDLPAEGHYRLDGRAAVPATVGEAMVEMENPTRLIARTRVAGSEVSTVMLPISPGAPPFETMVFGGPWDGARFRVDAWAVAERVHAEVVAQLRRKTRPMARKIGKLARGLR